MTLIVCHINSNYSYGQKWTINAGLDGVDKEELDEVLIPLTYTAS